MSYISFNSQYIIYGLLSFVALFYSLWITFCFPILKKYHLKYKKDDKLNYILGLIFIPFILSTYFLIVEFLLLIIFGGQNIFYIFQIGIIFLGAIYFAIGFLGTRVDLNNINEIKENSDKIINFLWPKIIWKEKNIYYKIEKLLKLLLILSLLAIILSPLVYIFLYYILRLK